MALLGRPQGKQVKTAMDEDGGGVLGNLQPMSGPIGDVVKMVSDMEEMMKPTPLPVMPLPDDDQRRTKARKSMAEQRRRRGRASTILTALSNEDKLGG